jgi:hypothetical protein
VEGLVIYVFEDRIAIEGERPGEDKGFVRKLVAKLNLEKS